MSPFRSWPFAALALGLTSAALTACAPSSNGPVAIMVIDRQSQGGQYGPVPQTFSTLTNLTGLKGSAAKFVGGARIIYNPSDPLLSTGGAITDTEEQKVVLKQPGADVRLNYVRRNGVYWPVDYQSWQMATTYWNMEMAFAYFSQVGLFQGDGTTDSNTMEATVYYYPYFQDTTQSLVQEYDNVFYFPPVQGFVIEPNLYDVDPTDKEALTTIPISMNRGAMAMQYSRYIFNQLVYGGGSFPLEIWGAPGPQTSTATPYPAYFYFDAFDVGLSLYHAAESLCTDGTPDTQCDDPSFLAPTYGALYAAQLDLTDPNRCLTQALKNEMTAQTTGNLFIANGHDIEVGAVIAESLYQAGIQTNKRAELESAVVAAYFGDSSNPGLFQLTDQYSADPSDLQYGQLADAIVRHITDTGLQGAVCGQFLDRLGLTNTSLPSCSNSTSNGVCPALQ